MNTRLAALLATCWALAGCASFYSGDSAKLVKEHQAPITAALASKQVRISMDSVNQPGWPHKCPQFAQLEAGMPPLLRSLGIPVSEATDADISIDARIVKCEDHQQSLDSVGSVINMIANGLSLLVIPYIYDNEVALEMTVKDAGGTVLYTAVAEEKATKALSLLALPFMLTNSPDHHTDEMMQTLLARHFAEMNAQGTFE